MWAQNLPDDSDRKKYKGTVEFSGLLPICHPDRACHNESLRKRGLLRDLKQVLTKLDKLHVCDQWDPILGMTKVKRIPDGGPYRFGVYRPAGKPWDCGRVKSRELIGSKLILYCDCVKKNGLQDDCHRTQCKGKPWCMYDPLPKCPPFTLKPGHYEPPDPYDQCPEKPWLKSPEYGAYEAMKKASRMRHNTDCIQDTKQLSA